MELRDLYDENKKITGETIYKGQEVPKGRYYITVVIFIQNNKKCKYIKLKFPLLQNLIVEAGFFLKIIDFLY